jgi:hypothetical protein
MENAIPGQSASENLVPEEKNQNVSQSMIDERQARNQSCSAPVTEMVSVAIQGGNNSVTLSELSPLRAGA